MDIDGFKDKLVTNYWDLMDQLNDWKLSPGKKDTLGVIQTIDNICSANPGQIFPELKRITFLFNGGEELVLSRKKLPIFQESLMEFREDYISLLDKYFALEREVENGIEMKLLKGIIDKNKDPIYCGKALIFLPYNYPKVEDESFEVTNGGIKFINNGITVAVLEEEKVRITTQYLDQNWKSAKLAHQFQGDVFNVTRIPHHHFVDTIIPVLGKMYLDLCYQKERN
jgi:hypothetical protein